MIPCKLMKQEKIMLLDGVSITQNRNTVNHKNVSYERSEFLYARKFRDFLAYKNSLPGSKCFYYFTYLPGRERFSVSSYIFAFLLYLDQYSFAPAGIRSSTISRFRPSLPSSSCTAEISIPQESIPIIARGGRFTMAIAVLPIRSSGS